MPLTGCRNVPCEQVTDQKLLDAFGLYLTTAEKLAFFFLSPKSELHS